MCRDIFTHTSYFFCLFNYGHVFTPLPHPLPPTERFSSPFFSRLVTPSLLKCGGPLVAFPAVPSHWRSETNHSWSNCGPGGNRPVACVMLVLLGQGFLLTLTSTFSESFSFLILKGKVSREL